MGKRLQCKTWPKKSLIAYQIAKRWVQAMSEWWTIHADPTIFRTSWNGRLERWVRRWIVGWEWRRQWWHWNCGTRKRKWRRGDSWWLDYHDLRQGRIASHEAGWIQSPNSPRQSLDLAWWPGLWEQEVNGKRNVAQPWAFLPPPTVRLSPRDTVSSHPHDLSKMSWHGSHFELQLVKQSEACCRYWWLLHHDSALVSLQKSILGLRSYYIVYLEFQLSLLSLSLSRIGMKKFFPYAEDWPDLIG